MCVREGGFTLAGDRCCAMQMMSERSASEVVASHAECREEKAKPSCATSSVKKDLVLPTFFGQVVSHSRLVLLSGASVHVGAMMLYSNLSYGKMLHILGSVFGRSL